MEAISNFLYISPNAQGHDGEKERLAFLQFRNIYSENIYWTHDMAKDLC